MSAIGSITAQVRKLDPKPADIVVVELDRVTDRSAMEQLANQIKEKFSDLRFITAPGMTVRVQHDPDDPGPFTLGAIR